MGPGRRPVRRLPAPPTSSLGQHRTAYLTDLRELALFLQGRGVHDPDHVRLTDLRRWLASQQASEAPATVARRAGTARVFFGWARETAASAPTPPPDCVPPSWDVACPRPSPRREVREL
nr:site-specific integrase [Propionibacterium freudenreichii]